MELTQQVGEVLGGARKYRRGAVERLLGMFYPSVYRMAMGLTGREDVGRGVIRFVYSRALRVLPAWKIETAPEHWFLHHTVLTVRRAAQHRPEAQEDVLVGARRNISVVKSDQWKPEDVDAKVSFTGTTSDAAYIAFIKAVRSLPQQQKEAFILNYGEKLEGRKLGVAMDCSMEAARNHLKAAEDAMRAIGGAEFAGMAARMGEVYRAATPDEAVVLPGVRKAYSRFMFPRRVKKLVLFLVIAGVAAGVWWVKFRK